MRDYIDNPNLKAEHDSGLMGALRHPLLLAISLCIVAAALMWLDISGFLAPARQAFIQVAGPAAQPLTGFRDGMSDTWHLLADAQQLRAENEDLRERQSQLQTELIQREQAMVENVRLRQQLEIQEQYPWHLLGADVVMRTPDAGRRLISVACGSADGVEVGMAVVGQTGSGPVALVGIVEEVYPHTASVLLTTDFGSRVSARVLHDGKSALGLVQGQWQRGSRLRLEQVDDAALLLEGATVISAGLSNELGFDVPLASVPPGVPIGEIEQLSSDGSEQFAELRPYADPDRVRYVWVIVEPKN
jgi:rod shape-determining protein MreC